LDGRVEGRDRERKRESGSCESRKKERERERKVIVQPVQSRKVSKLF